MTTYSWRKSSYSSAQGNCIQVAANEPGTVAVRDSKDPGGPVLRFTAAEWKRLLDGMKASH